MKYGLNEKVIQKVHKVLQAFPEIEKVLLYGSRAKGNYREGSDIDLCLFGKEIDLLTLNNIDIALDDLFLPYTFDLSVYNKLKNQDLISHIDRIGVIFYEKQ